MISDKDVARLIVVKPVRHWAGLFFSSVKDQSLHQPSPVEKGSHPKTPLPEHVLRAEMVFVPHCCSIEVVLASG